MRIARGGGELRNVVARDLMAGWLLLAGPASSGVGGYGCCALDAALCSGGAHEQLDALELRLARDRVGWYTKGTLAAPPLKPSMSPMKRRHISSSRGTAARAFRVAFNTVQQGSVGAGGGCAFSGEGGELLAPAIAGTQSSGA
jgi:hypothetical protein